MPQDYRTLPFHVTRVGDSGRYIGRAIYWKLYAIENLVRVIVNSVLGDEFGYSEWWDNAARAVVIGGRKTLGQRVAEIRADYARHAISSNPGTHDIYYVLLPDLTKIIASNSDFFRDRKIEIDEWIVRLEDIRLRRNMIGHMNWLDDPDKNEIDRTYTDLKKLLKRIELSGLPIAIPK
jgi:hypothetical protein